MGARSPPACSPPHLQTPRMPGTARRDHEEQLLSLSQGCVKDDPEHPVATSSWSLRRETLLEERSPLVWGDGLPLGAVSLNSFSLSTKPHSRSQLPRGSRGFVRLPGLGSVPEQPWEPLPGAGRSHGAGSQRRVWAGSSLGAQPPGLSRSLRALAAAPAQAQRWRCPSTRCFLPAGRPRGVS